MNDFSVQYARLGGISPFIPDITFSGVYFLRCKSGGFPLINVKDFVVYEYNKIYYYTDIKDYKHATLSSEYDLLDKQHNVIPVG